MVSVVVPIYKVEKYLDRCVESIFSQTYTNLEIILVDDGSPDNCPRLCDEYAQRDSRVKVVHKANGGLPDARNAGIDVATGEYILFVDSDDWIEKNAIWELVSLITEKNVDFVTFGAVWDGRKDVPDGTPCVYEKSRQFRKGYYDINNIKDEIYWRLIVTPDLFNGPILPAWSAIYSKKFLDDNGIRFDKEIKYSEDSVFSSRVVYAAKSFYASDKLYYHYCYNSASISQSFHKDSWDVGKIRYGFFEKYFKGCTDFDSDVQLKRMAIFCILISLAEWEAIDNKKERYDYVSMIFNDPFTIESMKHIKVAKVPLKKKLILHFIKNKKVNLYLNALK